MYWLSTSMKLLILPPAGPLLLALIGLVVSRRRPRAGWWLVMAGVGALALLSMPAIGGWLVRGLDRTSAFDVLHARDAQAIVILSGGTRVYAAEYGGPTIATITLQRVRYGAQLA